MSLVEQPLIAFARARRLEAKTLVCICVVLLSVFSGHATVAQNSGGGWVAQPNPALAHAPFPANQKYDWNGLTATYTITYSNGQTVTNTNTYPNYFNFAGTGIGNGCSETISAQGDSVFKWLWTPTGSNVAAPAPPLYVLGKSYGTAGLAPAQPGHISGLSGSALFDYTTSANIFAFGTPVTSTQYKVETASSSSPAQVSISTSFQASFSSSNPSDGSNEVANSAIYAYPIVLASPDPMGRPDLGDGNNQYVYSTDMPIGYLYIPGALQAVGSSQADVLSLLANYPYVSPSDEVDLRVENSTIANVFTRQWAASGSELSVNTPNNNYPGYQANMWIFEGLPAGNSSFGNHRVTLYVNGNASQQAYIQSFFDGLTDNWPQSQGTSANWFYYYMQLFTANLNPVDYQPITQEKMASETDGSSPYATHLRDSAYSSTYNTNGLRVFDIEPNYPKYVRLIGYLTFPSGIMQYIHEAAHERGHQYLDQLCGTGQRDGPIYTDGLDPTDPNSSNDGDIVVDNWEASHHMNAAISDTTHAYKDAGSTDAGDGDGELLADIQALPVVFNNMNAWQQDWADAGLQKGSAASHSPFLSSTVPSTFSLTFTPQQADVNGNVTATGASIQVSSIDDISTYYNTINTTDPGPIVTSLAQLGR